MNKGMEHILDPKLLTHLQQSNQVQSQLKLSIQQFSSPIQLSETRKSSMFRLTSNAQQKDKMESRNVGDATNVPTSSEQLPDRQVRNHLLMLMKLFDETKIMNAMRSFLTYDVYQVILASYKAKARMIKSTQPKTTRYSSFEYYVVVSFVF
jgi:hypothetical protein